MALTGFFMAVASDANIGVGDNIVETIKTTSLLSIISFGDIEAILSAFGFAIGVLFLSKLVLKHSSIEVAAASMFTSGLILVGFMIIGLLSYESNHIALPSNEVRFLRQPLINPIIILLLFSLLPLIGSLSYSTGLSMIGASLTATIGSSSILITIMIQMVLKEFNIASHLPENIFLAILGGVSGFFGICIIHMSDYSIPMMKRK
jgi:drug/metabolite transporter (DMT)-like permease